MHIVKKYSNRNVFELLELLPNLMLRTILSKENKTEKRQQLRRKILHHYIIFEIKMQC